MTSPDPRNSPRPRKHPALKDSGRRETGDRNSPPNSSGQAPRNPPDRPLDRLEQLRRWRNRPEYDPSLHFLKDRFKQEIEKPYKQLASLVELWQTLVPPKLQLYTCLESFQRGVLKVAVDSSAHLFELDRLLRQQLERQLITAHKAGTLRRVQLHVAAPQPPAESSLTASSGADDLL